MHESPNTQAILERMAQVRYDLDEDVQEIVEGARGMSQWRSYVRAYPWCFLGGALALGYLIVPRRALAMPAVGHAAAQAHVRLKENVRDMLMALAGNLIIRGASAFAFQQVEKLVASRTAKPQHNAHHE